MILKSIRLRLLVMGTVVLVATLVAAAWGLAVLFDRHAERVALSALSARADTLVAALERGADGRPQLVDVPDDTLFLRPLSGHYWQIDILDQRYRSRSLWDYVLPLLAELPKVGTDLVQSLTGPRGETLLVLVRTIQVGADGTAPLVRIAVATDRSELTDARNDFLTDLAPYLALLGLALVVAAALQITLGLRPLSAIGNRVAALTSGAARRIGSDLPTEVMPLAREIDLLLDARQDEVERARLRAGDLAHGLKTPLQALIGEAGRLRDRGEGSSADGIEEITLVLQRHIDRELTRARIAADHSQASTDAAEVVRSVVSVLKRTLKGAALEWRIEAEVALPVRMDRADLTEAIGALAENAANHALGLVTIRILPREGQVAICIRDDGPGADAADLETIRTRGVRLDEQRGGHGLGLAIVEEIVEAANGRLDLRNAMPGLEATLVLPQGA